MLTLTCFLALAYTVNNPLVGLGNPNSKIFSNVLIKIHQNNKISKQLNLCLFFTWFSIGILIIGTYSLYLYF